MADSRHRAELMGGPREGGQPAIYPVIVCESGADVFRLTNRRGFNLGAPRESSKLIDRPGVGELRRTRCLPRIGSSVNPGQRSQDSTIDVVHASPVNPFAQHRVCRPGDLTITARRQLSALPEAGTQAGLFPSPNPKFGLPPEAALPRHKRSERRRIAARRRKLTTGSVRYCRGTIVVRSSATATPSVGSHHLSAARPKSGHIRDISAHHGM